jgi:hypothetical protein
MVGRGFFEVPENVGRSHISYTHTTADIDRTLAGAEEALPILIRRSGRCWLVSSSRANTVSPEKPPTATSGHALEIRCT